MANPTTQVASNIERFDVTTRYYPLSAVVAKTYQVGEMMGRNAAGYAQSFDNSVALQFLGIVAQSSVTVDSTDSDGSKKILIERPQFIGMPLDTGTASRVTDLGKPVFSLNSGAVSLTAQAFGNFAGYIHDVRGTTIEALTGSVVFFRPAYDQYNYVVLSANGAINLQSGTAILSKAGVSVMTLINPTSGIDDGSELTVISVTASAHTITLAAAGWNGGATTIATFGGAKGDGFTLFAYQGKWYVKRSTNITLS